MDQIEGNVGNARTWRDIHQEVAPRAMSKSGRRRHSMGVARIVLGVLFIAAATWTTIALVNAFEYHPQVIAKATQSVPIRKLTLNTDGVLTREWVTQTLALPRTATLTEVDLSQLEKRLLASGQVRIAMLSKSFPDTLNVSLTERSPVARIKIQPSTGPVRELFVSRDGLIFDGAHIDPALVDSLPWLLKGAKVVQGKGAPFAHVSGMEVVADLLTKARYEGGKLYSLFRYISLARLESDGVIEVSSPECEALLFSVRDDFFRQLASLDYIRDKYQPTPENPLAKLDFTLGRDVAVTVSPNSLVPPAGQQPGTGVGARATPQGSASSKSAQGAASQRPSLSPLTAVPGSAKGTSPSVATSSGPSASQKPARPGTASTPVPTRGLQSPTRPNSTLPAFQNLQRNTTQREL